MQPNIKKYTCVHLCVETAKWVWSYVHYIVDAAASNTLVSRFWVLLIHVEKHFPPTTPCSLILTKNWRSLGRTTVAKRVLNRRTSKSCETKTKVSVRNYKSFGSRTEFKFNGVWLWSVYRVVRESRPCDRWVSCSWIVRCAINLNIFDRTKRERRIRCRKCLCHANLANKYVCPSNAESVSKNLKKRSD